MKRRAFTAIEALLSIGVIAVTAGISVPLVRNYQMRNDLNIATEYMLQALRTAQSNARAGKNTGQWGVYVPTAVVFEGDSYDARIVVSDEEYPLPPSVTVGGLTEVPFSAVSGRPQTSGEIILSVVTGEQRIITIGDQGTIAATGVVTDTFEGGAAAGEGGSSDGSAASGASTASDGSAASGASDASDGSVASGASQGASEGNGSAASGASAASDGSAASGASNASNGASNGAAVSSSASSVVLTRCEDRFFVGADGVMNTTGRVNAKVKALGSDITYGAGGPEIQVTAQWSTNGTTWTSLYNGSDIDGGELETVNDIVAGTRLSFKVTGSYSYLFKRSYTTTDGTGHIDVLRNGERPPSYPVFGNQNALASFLQPYIVGGKIAIGEYDAIVLVELGDLNSSSADFQDLVMLVQFEQEAGSCNRSSSSASSASSVSAGSAQSGGSAASADQVTPRFKVVFDRLQNVGAGDAARAVFVGSNALPAAESEWIPLWQLGSWLTDGSINENVAGLSVQRLPGKLRVVSHGSFPTESSKEILDARIVFEGVTVVGVENDKSGNNATENMINGAVNDTSAGDEVTIAADDQSVLFQTRVTSADDGVYIHFVDPTNPADADFGGNRGKGGSNKKIEVCHFEGSGYHTITVAERSWKAHEKRGDHLGDCESDADNDLIPNFQDMCPSTRVDNPRKYLLFLRYGLTENYSDIFREGPREKIGEFDLEDTMGCSCEQLLDIAEGKGGSYMTNLPKLYLQLRSLLDFYVTTARKFGCSRDLLRLIERNRN
jgi:type II secretory pathway pseudopilin PulG